MPKNPHQKLKLLYLRKVLLEQTDETHALTLAQLIKALEQYGIRAERKSIYDDLQALALYGLDVAYTPERVRRYYVAARTFQLPELKLLVDAVQSSRFLTRKKSMELISKVESLCSIHEAKRLQRQVFVANRIKTMNESIYYNIDKIQGAIGADEQISFRYFAWTVSFDTAQKYKKAYRHGGGRYRISPWALTWDDENYYMIGYDEEADLIKHYRVDKMEDIRFAGEQRKGQAHFDSFDMGVYSKKVFGMYGGREEMVTLCFDNAMLGLVLDRFGKDVFLTREDGERFRIHVKVAVSPPFFSWLFGLGTQVKILSPDWVAREYRDKAAGIAAEYQ